MEEEEEEEWKMVNVKDLLEQLVHGISNLGKEPNINNGTLHEICYSLQSEILGFQQQLDDLSNKIQNVKHSVLFHCDTPFSSFFFSPYCTIF